MGCCKNQRTPAPAAGISSFILQPSTFSSPCLRDIPAESVQIQEMQTLTGTNRLCVRCDGAMPPARLGRVCPRCLAAALGGGPLEEVRTEPVIGRFGEFELINVAGRGGMGVVYRARHVRLGREVALKMVASPVLAGEAAARRFRAEVEAMAGLDHPHLMPVYECGEVDGQAFYTMKFVEGGHLSARLRDKTWPQPDMIRLLVKVARAVDCAHRHGVLHRDLKPANIMVDAAGEPYVSDFGLARRLESDSSLTLSGAALGTPEYMAPEQASGQSSRVTTAADIYSLGAILYEMLAGRPPFHGGTPLETMRQVMEQEPVSPSTIMHTADRDLETIALKCLAKEPARRYASAAAFADDLDRWLRHEPITARRPGAVERTAKWLRRHPALASLLMLCLAGASAFLWQRWREEQRVKSERDRAEAGWATARARHYAADMDAVADALERGDYGVAAAKLESHRDSADRGMEWDIYQRALAGTQVRLLKANAPVRELAWSADGALLAAASTDERVLLWKAADGTPAGVIPDLSIPNEFDLGAWKMREAARRLRQQSAESTAALLAVVGITKLKATPHTTSAPAAHGLTFSPDASMLATSDNFGTKFWRLRDRWLHDWLPGHAGRGVFLDNTHYLLAEEDAPHDLGIFDLESGIWKVLHAGAGGMLAAAPDRRMVLTVHKGAQTLRAFSLPDGALLGEWKDDAFAAASRVVPVAGGDHFLLHTVNRPRILEGDWRARRWVRSLGEGSFADTALFALKSDRRLLAMTDIEQRVRLHQMSDGAMLMPLRGKRSPLRSMAWSPDNQTLATGEDDGSVRLWQPETKLRFWESSDAHCKGALHLSADGRYALGHGDTGISTVHLETRTVQPVHANPEALPAGYDGADATFVERRKEDNLLALFAWSDGKSTLRTVLHGTEKWKLGRADHAALTGSRWLTVSSQGGLAVRIHDRRDGSLVWSETAEWHSMRTVLSPDERTLAVGSENQTLRLLDWPAGTLRRTASLTSPVLSVAWLPDGRTLAAGCRDGTIRLLDAATSEPVASLNGHTSEVWALQVSPDGRRLVSAASDTRVRLWDLGTRQPLGRLPAGHISLRALGGFAFGGRAIAGVLWDGMVIVWRGE